MGSNILIHSCQAQRVYVNSRASSTLTADDEDDEDEEKWHREMRRSSHEIRQCGSVLVSSFGFFPTMMSSMLSTLHDLA